MDNQTIKAALALINRSPDVGGGWRHVSGACRPLLTDVPSSLVEFKTEDDGSMVRMTEEGQAVLMYS
jgi:hypothetical protein